MRNLTCIAEQKQYAKSGYAEPNLLFYWSIYSASLTYVNKV